MAKNYFCFEPMFTRPIFAFKPPTKEQWSIMNARWAESQVAWEAQVKKIWENSICGKAPAYSPSSVSGPFG